MRRAVIFLVVFFLCQAELLADQAQTISWRKDLGNALTEMQKKQHPMLLYVTMPGCVYCDRMKAETFRQKWIVGEVNKKYVPVQINGPQHAELTKQLNLRVYPTTAIVHPSGRVLEVLHGFQPASHVVKRMAAAKSKLSHAQFAAKPNDSDRN